MPPPGCASSESTPPSTHNPLGLQAPAACCLLPLGHSTHSPGLRAATGGPSARAANSQIGGALLVHFGPAGLWRQVPHLSPPIPKTWPDWQSPVWRKRAACWDVSLNEAIGVLEGTSPPGTVASAEAGGHPQRVCQAAAQRTQAL